MAACVGQHPSPGQPYSASIQGIQQGKVIAFGQWASRSGCRNDGHGAGPDHRGTRRRTALGKDGVEFFPWHPIFSRYFPFRRQSGPDSKLTARYPEIVERRIFSSRTILSHSSHSSLVHFLEYRHASRRRRPRQKGPEQVHSARSYQNGTRVSQGQASGKCHQISQTQSPWSAGHDNCEATVFGVNSQLRWGSSACHF